MQGLQGLLEGHGGHGRVSRLSECFVSLGVRRLRAFNAHSASAHGEDGTGVCSWWEEEEEIVKSNFVNRRLLATFVGAC